MGIDDQKLEKKHGLAPKNQQNRWTTVWANKVLLGFWYANRGYLKRNRFLLGRKRVEKNWWSQKMTKHKAANLTIVMGVIMSACMML